ncbi:MAG: hypothetical protein ACK417_11625 [Bacteroidia bacterium]
MKQLVQSILILASLLKVVEAQTNYSLTAVSYSSRYLEDGRFSISFVPLFLPALVFQQTNAIGNQWSWIAGAELQAIPMVSQYRFSYSDPDLYVPESRRIYENSEAGYILDQYAIGFRLQTGWQYQTTKKSDVFQMLLSMGTILPARNEAGWLNTATGVGPFASNSQFYNFHPNGPLSALLQCGYQRHFKLYDQTFFVASRIEYQFFNRPEVEFRVNRIDNGIYHLVSAFTQKYPRFYFGIGLGWAFKR